MTVDGILARKREVLAQRKTALAARERGEGDGFNLFFLNEELHDLNGQLRALRGAPRTRSRTCGGMSMDYARYADWLAGERDDEMREAHRVYIDAVKSSADVLTRRQKEIFDLWQGGLRSGEIAERLGVDRSTVSRTLSRAKARLREEAKKRGKTLRLEELRVFDLSDPEVARVLLSCLTDRQAVCLYLYYGEWLSLRECGELLGVDHTAVLRAVQRGLRAIQSELRCGAFTLDNADALSDLAYALYLEAGAPGAEEEAPRERLAWARHRLGYRPPQKQKSVPVPCTVRTSDGLVSRAGAAHRSPERPMGKLLTLLYTLRGRGPLYRWLARLFGRITKRREGHA